MKELKKKLSFVDQNLGGSINPVDKVWSVFKGAKPIGIVNLDKKKRIYVFNPFAAVSFSTDSLRELARFTFVQTEQYRRLAKLNKKTKKKE